MALNDPSIYLLRYNLVSNAIEGAGGSPEWNALTLTNQGGGGNPGGSNMAVQYNNSGTFGGDSTNFSWNDSLQTLTVAGKADDASDFTSTALILDGGIQINPVTDAGPPFGLSLAGICIRDTHTEPALGPYCLVWRVPAFLIEVTQGSGATPWGLTISPNQNVLLGDPASKLTYTTLSKLEVMGGVAIGSGYTGVNTAPSNGTIIQGQVGVGTPTPAASAVLDVTSTTQGILFPRLTTTQMNAISSPAEGLTIYNLTAHTIMFWNGSAWTAV